MPDAPTVFIIAGEVSGDLQAAGLAEALRRLAPAAALAGVGGARMAAAGVRLLEDSTSWGVIGYVEPLLRLATYLRRLRRVEDAVRAVRPDVLVLVDFAAFNLRLAERLRGGFPIAYYFPPMVSVRRGDRARKVARLRMRLLATLRREAEAYRAAGADVVYVGHPVADLPGRVPDRPAARARLGLPQTGHVVGLLPGSRAQEVAAHLPVMLEAAAMVARRQPAAFVLPVPASAIREAVEGRIRAAGTRLPALPEVRVVDDPHAAMAASDLLVAATGTATLEAAVLGVPLVAVYRLPALSWAIVRRVVSIRHAALPNLLAGREVVPELLQERLTAEAVAGRVVSLLRDPAGRERMRRELLEVAQDLGPPGAAERAAAEVLRLAGFVASPGRGG